MTARFFSSVSLTSLAATLLWIPAAQAGTPQSSVLRIRHGQFAPDVHRVVLDLRRLPGAPPKITATAHGWTIEVPDGSNAGGLPVAMVHGHTLKRVFYLQKTADKPARLVADFGAAPPPPAVAAGPARTTEQRITELFGPPAWHPAAGEPSAEASTVQVSGYVEAEGRWFPDASQDGAPRRLFGSFAAEPTLRFAPHPDHKFTVTGFGRVDTVTAARTHADLREAKYEGRFGAVDATVGVDRRFWGQLEAGHITDIVNQIDTLEDIDGEDKLGQPLAELKWTGSRASLALISFPYFRDRLFPDVADRPNGPFLVVGKPVRDGVRTHWTPDFASRGTLTAGPIDVSVHYFNGLNREPRLLGLPGGLTPVYDRMSQFGGDALVLAGPLRLKAEGYWRKLRNDKLAAAADHGGFGVGAEYTVAGALGVADLSVLAEYYHDTRGRAATTIFDDDVFAGFRYTGNDMASTEVLGGLLLDTRRSSKIVTLEASRRVGTAFKVALDVRLPISVAPDDPLWLMRDDGFVQLKLQYHF